MPVTPWYVAQRTPVWAVQEFQDPPSAGGQSAPLPLTGLTGSTIKLHMQVTDASGNPTGSDVLGVGTVNITDSPNGKFTYAPATNDLFVTTAGKYLMQWEFQFSGGSTWGDIFSLITIATV